jgi:hypothetical protein
VGEVALGVESLGDGLMAGELLAVVIGERVDKVGMGCSAVSRVSVTACADLSGALAMML